MAVFELKSVSKLHPSAPRVVSGARPLPAPPPASAPTSAPAPVSVAVNRNPDEPFHGELLVWVGAERQQGLGAPTRPAR